MRTPVHRTPLHDGDLPAAIALPAMAGRSSAPSNTTRPTARGGWSLHSATGECQCGFCAIGVDRVAAYFNPSARRYVVDQ